MATIDELVQQYQTDEKLQKEVADILADGKVSINEFLTFTKKHGVSISISEVPSYLEQARKMGFKL